MHRILHNTVKDILLKYKGHTLGQQIIKLSNRKCTQARISKEYTLYLYLSDNNIAVKINIYKTHCIFKPKFGLPCCLTLVVLYPDVPDEAIELEGEGEDVVVVRRVSHYEGSIRFIGQYLLCCLPTYGPPVPSTLQHIQHALFQSYFFYYAA